jgi:formate hydrogenlyase transcriptional activator
LSVPLEQLQPRATQPSVTLESMGREYVIRALRESNGAVEGPDGAAVRLGLKTATLHAMMRRLRIAGTDDHH